MKHIKPIDKNHCGVLLNLGGTVLVSAGVNGDWDVMPASWACNLDYNPGKATLVMDSTHYTRKLMDNSEYFSLQVATTGIAKETLYLGSVSKFDEPEKLKKSGVELFTMPGFDDVPLVKGAAAWLIFKKVSEPHNEKTYDLFIGECVGAWADDRVFDNGQWHFDKALELRTIHYVTGGQFYEIGAPINVNVDDML